MTCRYLFKLYFPGFFDTNQQQDYFIKKPADVFQFEFIKRWETLPGFEKWVENRDHNGKPYFKDKEFTPRSTLFRLEDDGYKWRIAGFLYGLEGEEKPEFGLPEIEYKKRSNDVAIG